MFRSFRFRLAAWYTTIVILTFILVAAIVSQNLHTTLSDNLDQSLLSEIRWIAERLDRIQDRSVSPQQIYHDIYVHSAYYSLKEYIETYDSTGRVFYRSPNMANDTLRGIITTPGPFVSLTTVENFRNQSVRIGAQRGPAGTVYLAMPTVNISLPVNHLLGVFGWLLPIVVVVSIAGGIYLANKSMMKVNQVIDAARTITVDHLDDRIPEQEVKDEIGRLISTFNEMIARLDYSFKQMRQFSADASHELRTPLAVMRAQLESVLTNKVSFNQMMETAANCLDETMHMATLVEHLLLLAKADAHQEIVRKAPMDLGALVHDLHDESSILASHRSITVELKHVEDATINGDAQRIRQMLLNLIDNAIKYNHPHGLITLNLEKSDGMAVLTIADTGIGIPAAELPKIFDRFYRVDKARGKSSGGVGLGLSIVKWTVEVHGGKITVTSELNKGTVFTVHLPLQEESKL